MDCNKRVCHISEDRISELPEEILVSILSLLSLKEAAKTSILSSRWRYLWTYFNGKVNFNKYHWIKCEWREFVDRINGILKLLRSPRLESFEVVFEYYYSVEEHIYPWIEFVTKKYVKRFQLVLGNKYILSPSWTLSAMPYLSFGSLEQLHLEYVGVGNETVQYILSNSPNLETIFFARLLSLSSFSIPSSSLTKLKKLYLLGCNDLKTVNISSRSLEHWSFKGYYRGRLHIDAKSASQLHSLRIGNPHLKSCSQLLYRLCRYKFPLGQLQTLHLDFHLMEEYSVTAAIKQVNLPILKHLQLGFINPEGGVAMLNCMNSILTAAPVLHTLEIRLAWRREESLKEEILYDKIVRPNLPIKVLKLTQFLGNKTDVMILKNFIESSESLQKLIINPYSTERMFIVYKLPDGAESRANERIKDLCENGNLSKRYLPSRIELIIKVDRDY